MGLTRLRSLDLPTASNPGRLALSPDGRHLYVGGRALSSFAIDPRDAQLTQLGEVDVTATQGLAFSADGSILLHIPTVTRRH